MDSSPVDTTGAMRNQVIWEVAHPETVRGAVNDIYGALEDAVGRLAIAGSLDSNVEVVLDENRKSRTWYGRRSRKTKTHECVMWYVGYCLRTSLFVDVNRNLYRGIRNDEWVKQKGGIHNGRVAFSEDELIEAITRCLSLEVDTLLRRIDNMGIPDPDRRIKRPPKVIRAGG